MIETDPTLRSGLIASLRMLADSLLGCVQDRVQLFSLEIQQEKRELIRTLTIIVVSIVTGALSVGFAGIALLYFVEPAKRWQILVVLSALFALTASGFLLELWRNSRKQNKPLTATIDELKKDRASICPP